MGFDLRQCRHVAGGNISKENDHLCYGRWVVKERIPIPAPQVIEALGKTWYALSRERKKRARQISAGRPG